ncbi:cell division protein FtsL [Staphylococcus hominis]|jgi:cell division protein FtsL|uniref:Cell division protein FtsL n=1 Tax=Staphylococcus hominis TaxID=1290 RepID=A0A974KY67_STAHO|nr:MULTISPECIES: cell division protein FtsL [Staphylococcus]OFU78076.1 cell division protein FtsL [Staphylococcus sp. HMSC10B09]AUJ51734.1 cell division protein FtsL [Staphylococcus hominis subsp. hominis]AYY65537.1 cell division protein FtsL [Staphylococcus hominis]EEK12404.1 cell division protein FtsL [Staphylococcus hominis SK119]EFS19022.1 cell division protein FtsL [Staphylococcus hominis subsp. hominis C80]
MAVEKIYEPYEHIQHTSIPKEQPKTQTETKTVTKKVVVQLTRFEKFLYITLVTAIAVLAIYMLSLKMDAYDTNDKIAELDQKIEQQSNENNAIQSEIKKNSSYERIYDQAKKQGMSLKNDNVKVVRTNGEAKN